MVIATNLGFPRIGTNRQLKKAQELYWKGNISHDKLQEISAQLRAENWHIQAKHGIEHIPSNDFSLYDHVLDMIAMVGAVPERYNFNKNTVDTDLFFAMARGKQDNNIDVVAMEMTKWFDTNYHYIVPEFTKNTEFKLSSDKIIAQYKEAKNLGIETRPVILGPISFLLIGKAYDKINNLDLLDNLLPIYQEILQELDLAGAKWVQIDEPCLVTDLDQKAKDAYKKAYKILAKNHNIKMLLTTYFGEIGDNLDLAINLPCDGIHIDLVKAPKQLHDVLNKIQEGKWLSLGLVDGRNIWKNNLNKNAKTVEKAANILGANKIMVAPSCSLLHSPITLENENNLDPELQSWLSFAVEKLDEISILSRAENEGPENFVQEFSKNAKIIAARKISKKIHNNEVKKRVLSLTSQDTQRHSEFKKRIELQKKALSLPLLPITTIGSFPQTKQIRQMRAKLKKQEVSIEEYDTFLKEITTELIKWQDDIGIDMPVHGEYERNDMVEYFGEQLEGYAFTKNGWVQSYGSRCVKPPIIFGDVSRPKDMTVRWSSFAQNLTNKPVKGMLTGPITMLQWAFVRDDQPRSQTCKQIALAIRDEVKDLESAGIKAIQIDEPAFREGLPLRIAQKAQYLKWAVESFKISSSGIKDTTQIHTHMCYSEFNDIINSIADLDADVISIETSRSAMELLEAFIEFQYPNEIGPGVYDIHSPRIPKTKEMEKLLYKALDLLDNKQVWVNPDCGLKTRNWAEVKPALINMVEAARNIRSDIDNNA
jgi:5-methyltetrahydropteroyltriglutamate--homocysteine methyltransferase